MNQGLHEELVTKLISVKLSELDKKNCQVKTIKVYKAETSQLLSLHIGKKYHYGWLYEEDGKICLKINLEFRF